MAKNRKSQSNWLDDVIGFFSPKARVERIKYRYAGQIIKRKYEGATSGRRTAGWRTASSSANSEIANAMIRLRDRARDLVRNNPWASRGLQVITSNVVGSGIQTKIKVDGRSSKTKQQNLNAMWKAWAGTTACDLDGRHDLKGLQHAIMRGVAEGGEVLVRMVRTNRRTVMGVEVPPIALQVIEADFLDTTRLSAKTQGGNKLVLGIEFDKVTNQRVAYHIYKEHPGAVSESIVASTEVVRVDASEMLHVFRMDRPGQIRGASWFAPIMIRLRDLDEFEDAELVRQKISSMFTAFVHDSQGIESDLSADEIEELGEKMEPGLIEILPPGKDVTLANPPSKEGYEPFVKMFLHSVAAGLGITYESLTGDLSSTNFSSARLGKLEMSKNIDTWQDDLVITQFMQPVFGWFLEGCELLGQNTQGAMASFTKPAKGLVDPTKEIPALKDAVRNGFMTLSEAVMERGKDPEEHFAQIQKDNETLDSLGLVLDSDPRVDQSAKQAAAPSSNSGQDE